MQSIAYIDQKQPDIIQRDVARTQCLYQMRDILMISVYGSLCRLLNGTAVFNLTKIRILTISYIILTRRHAVGLSLTYTQNCGILWVWCELSSLDLDFIKLTEIPLRLRGLSPPPSLLLLCRVHKIVLCLWRCKLLQLDFAMISIIHSKHPPEVDLTLCSRITIIHYIQLYISTIRYVCQCKTIGEASPNPSLKYSPFPDKKPITKL